MIYLETRLENGEYNLLHWIVRCVFWHCHWLAKRVWSAYFDSFMKLNWPSLKGPQKDQGGDTIDTSDFFKYEVRLPLHDVLYYVVTKLQIFDNSWLNVRFELHKIWFSGATLKLLMDLRVCLKLMLLLSKNFHTLRSILSWY